MKYQNVKTGAVIDVASNIQGEHWQDCEPVGAKVAPVQRKKKIKKDDADE